MRDLITDEMVETAAQAAYNSGSGGYDMWAHVSSYEEELYLEEARATLEVVAPAIAAAALRDAADWLDDMARGHRESAYLGAGRDLISRLRARADQIEKEGL